MNPRHDPNLTGRDAYEADRALRPNYHDGTPRPPWEALDEYAKWSWLRPLRDSTRTGFDAL